jgi:hypothetical protein
MGSRAPGQVSLTLDRDAAADLREVKAALSRTRDRVPTFSEVVRSLTAQWRERQAAPCGAGERA